MGCFTKARAGILAKLAGAAGLVSLLGGCAGQDPRSSIDLMASAPNSQDQYVALAYAAAGQKIGFDPAHHAVLSLPLAAGHVRAITASNGAAGFRQEVLLTGPASTPDRITLLTGAPQNAALDAALSLKPSETSIRAELAIEFPGSQMDVWPKPLANAFGPYGLASGQSGTALCVYAWQWIDDPQSLEKFGFPGPAAWRVRLCRPQLGVARAIAWLGAMTAGHAHAAPARVEAGPRNVRLHQIARKTAADPVKQARAAAIPAETGGDTGMADGGPRYLAPVPSGRFAETQTGSSPATDVARSPARDQSSPDMAADLPPEATRGPRTAADRVP